MKSLLNYIKSTNSLSEKSEIRDHMLKYKDFIFDTEFTENNFTKEQYDSDIGTIYMKINSTIILIQSKWSYFRSIFSSLSQNNSQPIKVQRQSSCPVERPVNYYENNVPFVQPLQRM